MARSAAPQGLVLDGREHGATMRCRGRRRSQLRQHRREDLEPQVLLVAQAVGAPLQDTDLAVQAFDEAKGHLVLRPAVCGDAVPVTVDHRSELLVALQALPPEAARQLSKNLRAQASRW